MKTDWDKLNGYVDGELDAAGAAEVATSVARDPDIAARVATLHRLKAAASAVSDRADAPAAPDQFAGNRSSGLLGAQSMIGMFAAAAALVLLVFAFLPTVPPVGVAHFDRAFLAQQAWLGSPPAVVVPVIDQLALAAPDLTAAQLSLVFAQRIATVEGQADVLYGYRGPHGCRLGLWISDGPVAAKSADPVRMSSSEGIDAFIWAHLDRSYVLMSKGMDGHRFENFASAITALVKRGQKLEEQDKIALRATIDSGEPCRS